MTTVVLPPVAAAVLVAAVDGLPARLRKKLDDAAAKLAGRAVVADGPRYSVTIDDTTTVTLVTEAGVVRSPDAVTCTCLLAPNCLHRAAILALAPVDAGDPEEPVSEAAPADRADDRLDSSAPSSGTAAPAGVAAAAGSG
ncbi:hypothetical protein, partial [Dactylosporangium fulvum]